MPPSPGGRLEEEGRRDLSQKTVTAMIPQTPTVAPEDVRLGRRDEPPMDGPPSSAMALGRRGRDDRRHRAAVPPAPAELRRLNAAAVETLFTGQRVRRSRRGGRRARARRRAAGGGRRDGRRAPAAALSVAERLTRWLRAARPTAGRRAARRAARPAEVADDEPVPIERGEGGAPDGRASPATAARRGGGARAPSTRAGCAAGPERRRALRAARRAGRRRRRPRRPGGAAPRRAAARGRRGGSALARLAAALPPAQEHN